VDALLVLLAQLLCLLHLDNSGGIAPAAGCARDLDSLAQPAINLLRASGCKAVCVCA
jgi:hypothetical protein